MNDKAPTDTDTDTDTGRLDGNTTDPLPHADQATEKSTYQEATFTPDDALTSEAEPEVFETPMASKDPVVPEAPASITLEMDEAIKALVSQKFVTLSSSVLDAADVASQAAKAANEAGKEFNESAIRVNNLSQSMGKTTTIVLASTAALMVLSIGFFTAMGVRLISKVNQLDATVMAVGTRTVKLNAGLDGVNLIGEQLTKLTIQQEQLSQSQNDLEQRIAITLAASSESVQKVPEALAKQMAASSSDVTKQVEGLGAQIKSQAGAVQVLSKEVKAMQKTVGSVNVLKRDVQALVTLQRERYLEQLQKQAAAAQEARRLPPVQYPRAAPPTAPTAAPQTNTDPQ